MTTANTITTEVPLVFTVDAMTGWLTAQRQLTADAFATAMSRAGHDHGPYMLAEAVMAEVFGSTAGFKWHSSDLAEQAKATTLAWSRCDSPSKLLSTSAWKALFGMVGYTVDGIYAEHPNEPIRLYRGATEPGKQGMSWSSDLAVAEFFATEHAKRAGGEKIWTILADPEDLLACITSHGESEYVVDPEVLVSDLVEVEEYIPADS